MMLHACLVEMNVLCADLVLLSQPLAAAIGKRGLLEAADAFHGGALVIPFSPLSLPLVLIVNCSFAVVVAEVDVVWRRRVLGLFLLASPAPVLFLDVVVAPVLTSACSTES